MTDEKRYAKLAELYGQLRAAHALKPGADYSLAYDSRIGHTLPIIKLTYEQVTAIAGWLIEEFEKEVEALNGVRRSDV